MSTRETQALIIETATSLFNEHGTKAISTNRIADGCELSRGNLHYHFRTKEEVIQTIFQQIEQEMNESWYEDHGTPTLAYLMFMFQRQLNLCWRYRFFYRELIALLQNDARLKLLFLDSRNKRVKNVRAFIVSLMERGLMVSPKPPITLDSLLLTSWLVSDQWLPHLDMYDIAATDEKAVNEGSVLVLNIFLPFFTDKGMQELEALGL